MNYNSAPPAAELAAETRVIDASGIELTRYAREEDAVECATVLALTGIACLIVLPGGLCLWLEKAPSGVLALKGEPGYS